MYIYIVIGGSQFLKCKKLKRRYVIPGDKIIEGNYKPLMNVMKSGDYLISTRVGIAEAGKDGVKVIPLSGVYIPRVNDLVIGKVIDRFFFILGC